MENYPLTPPGYSRLHRQWDYPPPPPVLNLTNEAKLKPGVLSTNALSFVRSLAEIPPGTVVCLNVHAFSYLQCTSLSKKGIAVLNFHRIWDIEGLPHRVIDEPLCFSSIFGCLSPLQPSQSLFLLVPPVLALWVSAVDEVPPPFAKVSSGKITCKLTVCSQRSSPACPTSLPYKSSLENPVTS